MPEATDGPVSIHLPNNWPVAVGVGALAAFVYAAAVVVYSLSASNVSMSGSPLDALGISWVMAFGTVGVPVALWFRYDLRWPLAIMGFVLLFLHGLAPFIADDGADAPAWAFAFWLAPVYVVMYAVVAYVESSHWRRLTSSE